MANHKIIGISGVTCAGKTTLAQTLVNYLGTNCVLISQDEFYRNEEDPNHQWIDVSPGLKYQNWEALSSIDWEAFTRAINKVIVEKTSSEATLNTVVLIEGHLILNYRPILELCQKKFFLTIEKNECFVRRNARTYLAADPEGYFESWVWPMYLHNFNQMTEIQNHIPIEFLNGNCDQNILFNTVIKSLQQID